MKIKVSDYIAKRLHKKYGVKDVFMVTGGGAMHLNNSFSSYMNCICNHHEQASALAAEGYSRLDQKLAVVNVTTGPGGLNTLNGVFGQWTDSVSVLYISGQVKYNTTIHSHPDLKLRQLGDQEVDIVSVVRPIVKYAEMLIDPLDVQYVLDKAIYFATHGRKGPVWIDVPMNIQSALIEEKELRNFIPPVQPSYDFKIDQVVKSLQQAQRPIFVVGHGVRLANSVDNLEQLTSALKIPIVTTFNGVDIITEEKDSYIGRIGTIGQRAGNFAIQNADLVIFLGTRNNIRQISYNWENFCKKAMKIVVDIDAEELNKETMVPDISVHGDLGLFISELQKKLVSIFIPISSSWLNFCLSLKNKYDFDNTLEYQQKNGENINPYYFVRSLTSLLKEKEVIVAANGSASVCLFQAGLVKKNQRILMNSGNASMGYDLPVAIGACFASGGREVICLAGDGSIMMNLQELQTIVHHQLPIKIFVLNNNGYISIRQTQKNFFGGHLIGCCPKSGVSLPDFRKIGDSFGLNTFRIEGADELESKIKKILSINKPILCDIILDPNYEFVPKLSSKKLSDGTMLSPTLEDMYPFLDRAEFQKNIFQD